MTFYAYHYIRERKNFLEIKKTLKLRSISIYDESINDKYYNKRIVHYASQYLRTMEKRKQYMDPELTIKELFELQNKERYDNMYKPFFKTKFEFYPIFVYPYDFFKTKSKIDVDKYRVRIDLDSLDPKKVLILDWKPISDQKLGIDKLKENYNRNWKLTNLESGSLYLNKEKFMKILNRWKPEGETDTIWTPEVILNYKEFNLDPEDIEEYKE